MTPDPVGASAGSSSRIVAHGGTAARIGPRTDALALAALVGTGLIITAPFFAHHGHWTYLDNPVHLAEAYSLVDSATSGWSDIGFCGFPLGTLHSPLWYALLASIGRLKLSIEPFFALVLLIGLLAPPIALYAIARRSVPPLVAALLSFLLLVRRGAIIGPAAALAGMWTFHLAAAAVYVLIDRLARRERTMADVAVNAALVGFIGLTHLFAAIALVLLAVIHLLRSIRSTDRAARLRYDIVAAVLGIAASARYWLGAWFDTSWTAIPVHNRTAAFVLESLVLSPPLDGWPRSWTALLSSPMTAVDIATQSLLIGLGLYGAWFLLRRRPDDDRALYGLVLAVVILLLLVGVLPQSRLAILGPISWRFTYFAVQGLTLASLPFLASLRGRWTRPGRGPAVAIAIAALAVAPIFGRPLWNRLPTDGQLLEVRQLWAWLAEHQTEAWGRTYVQNMDTPRAPDNLTPSGVLALTAHRSGIRQLGDYYDIVPFPTVRWTRSDRQILFSERIDQREKVEYVVAAMDASNATHLVTSDDFVARLVHVDPRFQSLYQVGRFTVFERKANGRSWAAPLLRDLSVDDVAYKVGRIRLEVTNRRDRGSLLIKESFDPQWRVVGVPGALLKSNEYGLMVVDNIPVGTHVLDLRYQPSHVPAALSLMGWSAILFLGGFAARRSARERTVRLVRSAQAV